MAAYFKMKDCFGSEYGKIQIDHFSSKKSVCVCLDAQRILNAYTYPFSFIFFPIGCVAIFDWEENQVSAILDTFALITKGMKYFKPFSLSACRLLISNKPKKKKQ